MDQLRKELEKKKALIKQAKETADKKYLTYGEINEIFNKESLQIIDKKNQNVLVVEAQGLLSENNEEMIEIKEIDMTDIPSRKEVIAQLRQRNQPIRIFGESNYEAYFRLKNIEIKQPDTDKGFTNDFQQAMQKISQEVEDNFGGGSNKSKQDANDVKITDDNTTIEELLRMSKELGKGDVDSDSQIIIKYLRFIVKCWGRELNSRPITVKSSYHGKMKSAQYTQTRNYLKPLLSRLRKRTLPDDLLETMAEIVKNALSRDYIKANEGYLKMAIGNAPWPIGVTMPGIHVRTGRERIASRHVAHVLNDETQRKYIQGLKRILTANQRIFPADPSKSIEYSGLLGLEL